MNRLFMIVEQIKFTYQIHLAWLPVMTGVLDNVAMPIFSTLFYLLIAEQLGNEDLSYYIAGSLCMLSVDSAINGTATIISNERRFGTIYLSIISPYSLISIQWGKMIYWCLIGVVRFLSTYLAMMLIVNNLNWNLAILLQYLVIYFLLCVSFSGYGLLFGILGIMKRNIFSLASAFSILIMLTGDVYFSASALPIGLNLIGYLFPLRYALSILRGGPILINTVFMLLIFIVSLCMSLIISRRLIKHILLHSNTDFY